MSDWPVCSSLVPLFSPFGRWIFSSFLQQLTDTLPVPQYYLQINIQLHWWQVLSVPQRMQLIWRFKHINGEYLLFVRILLCLSSSQHILINHFDCFSIFCQPQFILNFSFFNILYAATAIYHLLVIHPAFCSQYTFFFTDHYLLFVQPSSLVFSADLIFFSQSKIAEDSQLQTIIEIYCMLN